MTLRELYSQGIDTLDEAGIESPAVDAFYLLEYLTGISRAAYLLDKEKNVTDEIKEKYSRLIEIRASHVPYQYITGECEFYGFPIKVNENVLIPRLDTEVLADEAIKLIPDGGYVMDMCTGSGCIAIAIKKSREDAAVSAADISPEALETARENAQLNEAEITFAESNLFEETGPQTYDVIVSNPPYVTEEEYKNLDAEVKDHEPELALTAGTDGLDIYRKLIPQSADHLKNGGYLIMEIGCFQANAVVNLMSDSGFKEIKIIKDLAGLDRVVRGQRNI